MSLKTIPLTLLCTSSHFKNQSILCTQYLAARFINTVLSRRTVPLFLLDGSSRVCSCDGVSCSWIAETVFELVN